LKRTKTNSEGILLVGKRKNSDEGFSLLVALQKKAGRARRNIPPCRVQKGKKKTGEIFPRYGEEKENDEGIPPRHIERY
jgi:hypothetical protein